VGNLHRYLLRGYERSDEESSGRAFDERETHKVADVHAIDGFPQVEVGVKDGPHAMHEDNHTGSGDSSQESPEYSL
jgi:hypothetical protein